MGKRALITGITGQDGRYLGDLLASTGDYDEIYGLTRRVVRGGEDIFGLHTEDLFPHLFEAWRREVFKPIQGNLVDFRRVYDILSEYQFDEVYNLGAQSHVGDSFVTEDETYATNDTAVRYMLSALKKHSPHTCFYQAGTSEQFGNTSAPQNEGTPMLPVSPYGIAKRSAYDNVRIYRDMGLFCCTGILFNHESPIRGEKFVTRKITMAIARMERDMQSVLWLGNLQSVRDWGHARDYVRAQYLLLQQDEPRDFVIATGIPRTIEMCVETAYQAVGCEISWDGEGLNRYGYIDGCLRIATNEEFYRPNELNYLCGDASRAQRELGWQATTPFSQLIKEMVEYDSHLLDLTARTQ